MVLGAAWLNPSYIKYPLISLRGAQELLPPPFLFSPSCLCEAMWAVGIVPGVFAGEPGPRHCDDAAPAERSLEAILCITPGSVRERTLIGIRGLEDLAF